MSSLSDNKTKTKIIANSNIVSNRCTGYVLSRSFDFEGMASELQQCQYFQRHKEALQVTDFQWDVFLFEYGVIVCWGTNLEAEARLKGRITNFFIDVLPEPITDYFTFSHENDARQLIKHDHITIDEDDSMVKLAVSHGIAQSLKLAELELYAEKTINKTSYIPRNMAKTGSTQLSRKDIARMRGDLFLVESDILLHHALLDTPEFFWEYPELEGYYNRTATYLDVKPRVDVLNKKLQIIHDIFGMLADEQKHKHSSILEWIIIWLIAIEIVIFLVHDFFKII